LLDQAFFFLIVSSQKYTRGHGDGTPQKSVQATYQGFEPIA